MEILSHQYRSKAQLLVPNSRYERIHHGPLWGPKRSEGGSIATGPVCCGGGLCNRELRRIPIPRTPVNKVLIRKPSGNVARCVSETHGPPKLPEGYRLDLADDPDAPALRRPDGTVVARFGARGMTHQAVEREALEDLLGTSRKPGGVESELIEALRRPQPT